MKAALISYTLLDVSRRAGGPARVRPAAKKLTITITAAISVINDLFRFDDFITAPVQPHADHSRRRDSTRTGPASDRAPMNQICGFTLLKMDQVPRLASSATDCCQQRQRHSVGLHCLHLEHDRSGESVIALKTNVLTLMIGTARAAI